MSQLDRLNQAAGRDAPASGGVSRHAVTARDEAIRAAPMSAAETEVARQMQICNACRYCEGFCAVFPAMTRRLEFAKADVNYLANLCHNCTACYDACQYAPPHEFAVNVPKAMADVRRETYAEYAWPAWFAGAYRHSGLTTVLVLAAGLSTFVVLDLARRGALLHEPLGGDFYAVLPHSTMAAVFGAVFLFALAALAVGVRRFWNACPPGVQSTTVRVDAAVEAAKSALMLKYLDGGHGDGCNEEDDRFTLARRRFHHFTFYGFMLCFAATCVGTLYHYLLGREAPYPLWSIPVLLGSAGGIGLLIGPAGLLWLNIRRNPDKSDRGQRTMDRGFIALLLLASLSGFLLLAGRDSSAMAVLLAVHLGTVLALFATMPYGKFAHGGYRVAALLKYSIERRQPNPVQAGSD